MTQPTEQQGNQPESSEQPVYQPAPSMDQPATVCPSGSYRRPVRSGRADCGCAFAASTVDLRHGDSYRQHGDCAVAMAGRMLPPLLVGVACFGRHHSDCGSRAL